MNRAWNRSGIPLAFMFACMRLATLAESLGRAPQFNLAVQGQTGARQPDRSFISSSGSATLSLPFELGSRCLALFPDDTCGGSAKRVSKGPQGFDPAPD